METPRTDGPTRDEQRSINWIDTSKFYELPVVLKVPEAATYLRIGRNQAYDMVRRGEIAAVRCGSSWRIPRAALIHFLAPDA
jgi:excisionase family DNA binding protein